MNSEMTPFLQSLNTGNIELYFFFFFFTDGCVGGKTIKKSKKMLIAKVWIVVISHRDG